MSAVNELLMALMMEASMITGLPVPEEPPALVLKTDCELWRYNETGSWESRAACPVNLDDMLRPLGLYISQEAEPAIYVSSELELATNYLHMSIVFHELVHYMQDESGSMIMVLMTGGCAGMIEAEAYEAQADWLARRGIDYYAVSGVSYADVEAMASCQVGGPGELDDEAAGHGH